MKKNVSCFRASYVNNQEFIFSRRSILNALNAIIIRGSNLEISCVIIFSLTCIGDVIQLV